jgi:hypothetical protein
MTIQAQVTQHVFNVQLIVKGDSRYRAYTELAKRLNKWFMENLGEEAPYKEGSLLLWSSKE